MVELVGRRVDDLELRLGDLEAAFHDCWIIMDYVGNAIAITDK